MKAFLILAALAIALTAALSLLSQSSQELIVAEQKLAQQRQLLDVLEPARYNNQPWEETRALQAGGLLANAKATHALVARLDGQISAILIPVTAQGYEGPIQLLTAISPNGQLLASKVLAERETQGLADFAAQARQTWLASLAPRRLDDPPKRWQLKTDGGEIDHIAGATRTSKAINDAHWRALSFFAEHQAQLLERQP